MVDSTLNLGRNVATPSEVLEVCRAQLKVAALVGPMLQSVLSNVPAPPEPGKEDEPPVLVMDGPDLAAYDAVFTGLLGDAVENVGEWARDVAKVYDKEKLRAFLRDALDECFNGDPSDAVLDAIDTVDGDCESIGLALQRLSAPADGSPPAEPAASLAGSAARYFQRV